MLSDDIDPSLLRRVMLESNVFTVIDFAFCDASMLRVTRRERKLKLDSTSYVWVLLCASYR